MPKLRNLLKDSAKLKIEFEGEDPLIVEYHPKRATDDLFSSVTGFESFTSSTAKETLSDFNNALLALIEEWNLQDDDNTVIPLTPEGMSRVYIPIKTLILSRIRLDMGGN